MEFTIHPGGQSCSSAACGSWTNQICWSYNQKSLQRFLSTKLPRQAKAAQGKIKCECLDKPWCSKDCKDGGGCVCTAQRRVFLLPQPMGANAPWICFESCFVVISMLSIPETDNMRRQWVVGSHCEASSLRFEVSRLSQAEQFLPQLCSMSYV